MTGNLEMRMPLLEKVAKMTLAIPILIVAPLLWIVQLVIFSPLLLIAHARIARRREKTFSEQPILTGKISTPEMFNRVNDVSKLYGCNTRNVNYRWPVFIAGIRLLEKNNKEHRILNALDFGAGSLRDTYELARMGFAVDAIDKNATALHDFTACYDWKGVPIQPMIQSVSLFDLKPHKQYDLVIAFDVLEHLYDLENHLTAIRQRLVDGGLLFVTVPNKHALWERYWRKLFEQRKRRKLPYDLSGVPHVQFRTPEEWKDFFKAQRFEILSHDMAIGFLVNDCWAGFYGYPIRLCVEPILLRLSKALKLNYRPLSCERLFYPPWLMGLVNKIDLLTGDQFKNRWGWNLFVLSLHKLPADTER